MNDYRERWGNGVDIFTGLKTRAHTLENGLVVAENSLVVGNFPDFGDTGLAFVQSVSSQRVACCPFLRVSGIDYDFVESGGKIFSWDDANITETISVEQAARRMPAVPPTTLDELDAKTGDYVLWLFDPKIREGNPVWELQWWPAVAKIVDAEKNLTLVPVFRNSNIETVTLHENNPIPRNRSISEFLKKLTPEEATVFSLDIWPPHTYWCHYDPQTGVYLG